MDVLISGATGLIGSALVPELEAAGHRVRRLTRTPRSAGDIRWDPEAGMIEGDPREPRPWSTLAARASPRDVDGGEKAAHPREPAGRYASSGRALRG